MNLKLSFRVDMPYRVFNTWMGDPGKLLLLQGVIEVIKKDKLLSVVQESGKVLRKGLDELSVKFPALIHSVRGRGTFLSFTANDSKLRDKIVTNLRQKGKNTIYFYMKRVCIVFSHLIVFLFRCSVRWLWRYVCSSTPCTYFPAPSCWDLPWQTWPSSKRC
jgi:4-aminobutyrate aminotransferase-like enzyme